MPLTRSQQMSRIRSSNTLPERCLRSALWQLGLRYRLGGRRLPGKPDLVFSKQRLVVFMDGCFWHGCPWHFVHPRTRVSFWSDKIKTNVLRDAANTALLLQAGWRVLRVWEHEVENGTALKIVQQAVAAPHNIPRRPSWRVLRTTPLDADWRRERCVFRDLFGNVADVSLTRERSVATRSATAVPPLT
jgi:DNA mismatch endonuclease, patch repair protein